MRDKHIDINSIFGRRILQILAKAAEKGAERALKHPESIPKSLERRVALELCGHDALNNLVRVRSITPIHVEDLGEIHYPFYKLCIAAFETDIVTYRKLFQWWRSNYPTDHTN